MIRPRWAGALATSVLTACGSLSGLEGRSHYACRAPEGVACQSVSGTYANTATGTTAPRPASGKPTLHTVLRSSTTPSPSTGPVPNPTADDDMRPLRSAPRVLRLWFKPWEDADHDLYDQGFVYVQVDDGRWQIDHAPRAIRGTSPPLRPPVPRAANAESSPVTSPTRAVPLAPQASPGSVRRPEPGTD